MSGLEASLCALLRQFPQRYGLRFTVRAKQDLQQALFWSLVDHDTDELESLFRGQIPSDKGEWLLSEAQGMTEGMEYTESARGKPCGHIFKNGDAVFRCKTCTEDETAVLCTRCFEASDHTDHVISQSISLGNSGCCDCGDEEAFIETVNCAIHSVEMSEDLPSKGKAPALGAVLQESIRITIGRALDYVLDVISCSPENLRQLKSEESVRRDAEQSRLSSTWYKDVLEADPEFAVVLWNDEKHTIIEVRDQVARACKQRRSFGERIANTTHENGRAVIQHSKNLAELLKIAEIIEQIKITVTIRSSRDTFREEMCGAIIEWLVDIVKCSIRDDHFVLRRIISEQLLSSWRPGSEATNKFIGKGGLDDHDREDSEHRNNVFRDMIRRQVLLETLAQANVDEDSDSDGELMITETEDETNDGAFGAMDIDMIPTIPIDPENISRMPGAFTVTDPLLNIMAHSPVEIADLSNAEHAQGGSAIENSATHSQDFLRCRSSTNLEIPTTSALHTRRQRARPPSYWLELPPKCLENDFVEPCEDLKHKIRLDWLLLYDLRLWKKARIDARDLFIAALIGPPETKRIFGLRFAGLYSVLGQLYLIADREPDYSIINLSVQTFTTPSVTQEVIERGNFLTTLLSMLYTFLTQRSVQHPWQISIEDSMASENSAVSNRRMYHFFHDLERLFASRYVREELRSKQRYQLQFLDLIRLPQGISPNIRAISEHVEYENDIWISAQILTKEINKLVRQFAEIFHSQHGQSEVSSLQNALRLVAKATIINSIGGERMRFGQAEIKSEIRFKTLAPVYMEHVTCPDRSYKVIDFAVEKEHISFHHPLHYTLSWLIDAAKGFSADHVRLLLTFTYDELRESPPYNTLISDLSAESYMLAVFDFPLRVCTWLAQMKAGMWVRNGLSLRHQMTTYKGIAHRDLAHHRDIFLLQTALVVCDPSRMLMSMIERYGLDNWIRGNYECEAGFEPLQKLDVAEDLLHLLIILLSDRTSLHPSRDIKESRADAVRRDIAHILCFKPLSFSDLDQRFADKSTDLEYYQDILDDMTVFRPPEGVSDTGTFELKSEFFSQIDPYTAHYNKNQRDEAEHAYKVWMAKKLNCSPRDIVYEPRLVPITTGMFKDLSMFTQTPVFAQLIFYNLLLCVSPETHSMSIPANRVESYMHITLHLVLVALCEEKNIRQLGHSRDTIDSIGFSHLLLTREIDLGLTSFDLLWKLRDQTSQKVCQVQLVLNWLEQCQSELYATVKTRYEVGWRESQQKARLDEGTDEEQITQARQLKKKQALARQAKVMAQFQEQQKSFLSKQDIKDWEDGDIDLEHTGDEHTTKWKFPTGNCILCQEETNDTRLYGTFGMMIKSNLFRQTSIKDPLSLREVITSPESLDRLADGSRPFGRASYNRSTVVKRGSSGKEIIQEHQGLSQGFPHEDTDHGPVSTGCGHLMHFACFGTYLAATQRRHRQQITRQQPERLIPNEFVCPLCKTLGNAFLPIIWKSKQEAYPSILQPVSSFHGWLGSEVGPSVSKFLKAKDVKSYDDLLRELFSQYIERCLCDPIVDNIMRSRSDDEDTDATTLVQTSEMHHWDDEQVSVRGQDNTEQSLAPTDSSDRPQAKELTEAYARLKQTVLLNDLGIDKPAFVDDSELDDEIMADAFIRILGQSIAGTEIAQRAVPSESCQSLLSSIPNVVLTHLKIFSETVSSYIALEVTSPKQSGPMVDKLSEAINVRLRQLFAGHPQIINHVGNILQQMRPALMEDSFTLLSECAITLSPALHMSVHHLLQTCYILELVKTCIYITGTTEAGLQCEDLSNLLQDSVSNTKIFGLESFLKVLFKLMQPLSLGTFRGDSETMQRTDIGSRPNLAVAYKLLEKYALVFLRKATILMHVWGGVNFPESAAGDEQLPELIRLSNYLNLPQLDDILSTLGNPNVETGLVHSLMGGWIQHWRQDQAYDRQSTPGPEQDVLGNKLSSLIVNTIRLPHPVIYELVGLPKYFDYLIYDVTRRRCPTKGRKVEDPCLCLFCGRIACGQALCCTVHDQGGCYRHSKVCGRNVGLFLNIRKCAILFLHNNHGSWHSAPYLDKYGESDVGLRRGRQLVLNQARYDKLFRHVWLNQGIPTYIARRLEPDLNHGGWETL